MRVVRALVVAALVVAVFACGEAPRYEPLPAGTAVLAFGDSATRGVGAADGLDWPSGVAALSGWRVINAGMSGDTAANGRTRIAAALAETQPRLVIIEIGGNDFLRRTPAVEVKDHLAAIVAEVERHGAIPVLVAVPELSLFGAAVGRLSDSAIYAELADETGVVLVEDVFSEVLSDDALRADRIHPNADGYRLMAEAIVEELRDAGLIKP